MTYSGGLTGGKLAVGYSIKYSPTLNGYTVTSTAIYNGNEYHNMAMVTAETLTAGSKDEITWMLENIVMHSVGEAILDNIDSDELAERLASIADGSYNLGDEPTMTFESLLDDTYTSEYVHSITSDAQAATPVQELVKACSGLSAMVEYPGTELSTDSMVSVYTAVQWLNDFDKWSFDQIADWLETLDIDLSIDLSDSEGGDK